MSELPYLSVVVASRNDDHGGNAVYRTQLFVSGLLLQCDRHRLPAELVLVEWNPPPDRPRLAEVLDWPETEGWCSVRIIEVPNELHRTLEHSQGLPLFQMIGKNVGIRRARGEFVLCTNIDILFSDELMGWIAARRLEHGHAYRVDRFDVPAELDPGWDLDRRLAFCRDSVIRINRREGTLDTRSGEFFRIYPDRSPRAWLRNRALGRRLCRTRVGRALGLARFAAGSRAPRERQAPELVRRATGLVRAVYGTIEFVALRIYALCYWFVAGFNDPRKVPERFRKRVGRTREALFADAPPGEAPAPAATAAPPATPAHPLVRVTRATGRAIRRKARSLQKTWRLERARIPLHTNASGDFTLLARDDWERTGGYLEFQMYSMHVDGLLLYAAHHVGIREAFLPFPVYHVEHGGGFRPEVEGPESLDEVLASRSVPKTTDDELLQYIWQMHTTGRPLEFNSDDWGFSTRTFPETSPGETLRKVGT